VAAGIPEYASDIRPVRGKCLGKRCRSRWGVVRVSLDFRDPERIDRIATLECADCGRTWRRVPVPRLTSPQGYQTVRLTLILRATVRRWISRGRWHREGDDAIVVPDANVGDLDEAARNHAAISDRLASRKALARSRKAEREAAEHERTMAMLARWADMDAAYKADEAAAAAREAA
jgi:hypothetical protein